MKLQINNIQVNNQKNVSPFLMTVQIFFRHKMAVFGLIILITLGIISSLAYEIMPYEPNKVNVAYSLGIPKPPSNEHIFGTDDMGRDWFSRCLVGSRVSLFVGFISTTIAAVIGVVLGSIAGYFGGFSDSLIMRFSDILLSLPLFLLMITAQIFLQPSIFTVMVVIGIFNWMGIARLIRGEFLRLKNVEYLVAAHCVGCTPIRIITRHLIPNSLAPVLVAITMMVPAAIVTESALSFLGFGVTAPDASWGNMLTAGKMWMREAWWMWLIPGLLISITVMAFNFFGDGLRDALDPIERGKCY